MNVIQLTLSIGGIISQSQSQFLQIVHKRSQPQETSEPYRQPSIGSIQRCRSCENFRGSGEIYSCGIGDTTARRRDGVTSECTVEDRQADRVRGGRNGLVAYDNFGY